MTTSSIDVRDYTANSAKSVKSSLDSGSVHTPHHVLRYAITDDMVYGVASTTDTADHQLIVAPAASPATQRNYVQSVQVANKGGTAALIAIKDGAASSPDQAIAYLYCPAGNSVTAQYLVPIRGSVGNAIYFSADASSTTIYVSAQGFVAE